MKKQSKKTSKTLPVLTIKSITDVLYSRVEMDMDDGVYTMLKDYGKQVVTDDDYVNIGFIACIQNGMDITPPKKSNK